MPNSPTAPVYKDSQKELYRMEYFSAHDSDPTGEEDYGEDRYDIGHVWLNETTGNFFIRIKNGNWNSVGVPAGSTGLTPLGTWDASTNTPAITGGTGTPGEYYVVASGGNTSIDGENDWQPGDWIIFDAGTTTWKKIDNSEPQGSTFDSVASQAAQLALTGLKEGDIVKRTDEDKTYIHNGGTAGTMADFDEIGAAGSSFDVVASQAAQLALINQKEGDIVKRTDESKTYIHNGGTSGTMADYDEIGAAASKILSGAVAPVAGDGADGDYHFNTATKEFYWP
ncbi:MAG: hypothetical protein HC798_02705 [Polaribacter sp.]|nr:hypothetical protein [Polaribacter sp.]